MKIKILLLGFIISALNVSAQKDTTASKPTGKVFGYGEFIEYMPTSGDFQSAGYDIEADYSFEDADLQLLIEKLNAKIPPDAKKLESQKILSKVGMLAGFRGAYWRSYFEKNNVIQIRLEYYIYDNEKSAQSAIPVLHDYYTNVLGKGGNKAMNATTEFSFNAGADKRITKYDIGFQDAYVCTFRMNNVVALCYIPYKENVEAVCKLAVMKLK